MCKTVYFKIICFFAYLQCNMIECKRYDDIKTDISNSIRFDATKEKYDENKKKHEMGRCWFQLVQVTI